MTQTDGAGPQAQSQAPARATLVLEDGSRFEGRSFGAHRHVRGEVVFNTGMTGYVEALTDPSYRGQLLVLTYPLQGNYGVPDGPFESEKLQVQALIVSEGTRPGSHYTATKSLGQWLSDSNVPAVEGIDTRQLTRHLRERGTMRGELFVGERAHGEVGEVEMAKVARLVAPSQITRHSGGDLKLLVIDTGAKENILRSLQTRGASCIRAPFHLPWEPHLSEVDGVVLTNGPGDPSDLPELISRLRPILASGLPLFGICLGHQLLALAAGAKTYKLKYGHRSQNQPVMNGSTGRAYVTSQNHGYAVDPKTLPPDWEEWFVNLNDGTNEGIRHAYRPYRSVQFHPEAAAGPHDTATLFDDYLRMVGELRKGKPREEHRTRLVTVAT